jgi:hypothetical protein
MVTIVDILVSDCINHSLGVSNYLRTILEVHCVEVPPFAAPDEAGVEGLGRFSGWPFLREMLVAGDCQRQ